MLVSTVSVAQSAAENPSALRPSLARQLRQLAPDQQTTVLVSLHQRADLEPFRRLSKRQSGQLVRALKSKAWQEQQEVRKLLKQHNVKDARSLWINNSLVLTATPEVIRQIARLPEVQEVAPDTVVHLGDLQTAQSGTPEWHLHAVEAPLVWSYGVDGTGVVIAGMDTGVDVHHPDLASRWRGGTNSWKDVHGQHVLPYDYHGHGTATMGIMVGGDAGGTAIGVAPGAQWIAVKIFDDSGNAPYSKIHEGFQWLLDPAGNPDTPDAPDIVNNSWGLHFAVNQCIAEFQHDIETLKAAGIAVVFAAGNSGPLNATSVSPANNTGNLSVGAVDESGLIASFSSRGPAPCNAAIFPTLSAPGKNIKTADLTGGGVFPDSYAYVAGTSYAAAVVSGSMALLLSAFPEMSVTQLEKTLLLSAADPGDIGPDYIYGNGIINTAVAYEYAASVCPADVEKDYVIDLKDLMILLDEWLRTDCSDCRADLSQDGVVDLQDYALLAAHFGKDPCPSLCIADIDTNYEVGLSDLTILASEWLLQECATCQADVNGDKNVDYRDFVLFAEQFANHLCP